jgi:hypothetical protein
MTVIIHSRVGRRAWVEELICNQDDESISIGEESETGLASLLIQPRIFHS